jgi:segregation and condensation protein A
MNPTTEKIAVKTAVFEGPLELLLELVERRKLLINDISLAAVTDEYMAQVSEMQERSLPNTVVFIQLAATLLLLKSKSLLPVLDLTSEEEQGIDDLEARLRLYQIYRDAGRILSEQFGQYILHERQYVADREPLFVTDSFTTLDALKGAMDDVLKNLPIKDTKPKVQVRNVITLEEMMTRLHHRIETELRLRFSDLVDDPTERVQVIVGFLAILESVKQGSILVAQAERFADIHMEREGVRLPNYL